jgi:hypothetical protein
MTDTKYQPTEIEAKCVLKINDHLTEIMSDIEEILVSKYGLERTYVETLILNTDEKSSIVSKNLGGCCHGSGRWCIPCSAC